MKREDAVDFFLVRDGHLTVHERLERWGRWVKPRRFGWHIQPMFKHYRPSGQWERQEPKAVVNELESAAMEKAVSALPEKNREAIRWIYVHGGSPLRMARTLGVSKAGLMDLVHAGRVMLLNRGA